MFIIIYKPVAGVQKLQSVLFCYICEHLYICTLISTYIHTRIVHASTGFYVKTFMTMTCIMFSKMV